MAMSSKRSRISGPRNGAFRPSSIRRSNDSRPYICVGSQSLLLSRGPGLQQISRRPCACGVPNQSTIRIWGVTNGDRFNSCQVIYSQFGLAIHQNDHQARRRFVEWAQNEIAVVPDFHQRILFSDEAHFWLNGYVNKQNCRIWSEANPQVYVRKTDCLVHFMGWWNPSSKTMKATTLQSMVIGIEP
ncbi:uncharacterized protein TNCV_3830661 [Trichonephila clavipes]|nr:uncharacterized protein TNCV_3830661 [Trichonephila clavipes]